MADGRPSFVAFIASLALAILAAGSAPWRWPETPPPAPAPAPAPSFSPLIDQNKPEVAPVLAPTCVSGFFLQTASGMQKTIGLPYDATQNALRAKPRPELAGACFVEFTDAAGYPVRFGALLPRAAQVREAQAFASDFTQEPVPASSNFYAAIGEPYRRVFWVDQGGLPRNSW